jgi:hypothetical protein
MAVTGFCTPAETRTHSARPEWIVAAPKQSCNLHKPVLRPHRGWGESDRGEADRLPGCERRRIVSSSSYGLPGGMVSAIFRCNACAARDRAGLSECRDPAHAGVGLDGWRLGDDR